MVFKISCQFAVLERYKNEQRTVVNAYLGLMMDIFSGEKVVWLPRLKEVNYKFESSVKKSVYYTYIVYP